MGFQVRETILESLTMRTIKNSSYQTLGGIQVRRSGLVVDYAGATQELARQLDDHRGVLLSSSYEYPGRYARWDIGFVNPPLQLVASGRRLTIEALNTRGETLLPAVYHGLVDLEDCEQLCRQGPGLSLTVKQSGQGFAEEMRSRQPSVFSVLRQLVKLFAGEEDEYLGLYGSFGYDLGFQFEDVTRYQARGADHRDLVLYLPDQILVCDHRLGEAISYRYEFVCRSWESAVPTETTGGLKRRGRSLPFGPPRHKPIAGDHAPGEYADSVRRALQEFRQGNLFEVVPGQVLERC